MLSAYETPQIRALFNNPKLLKNVSGRVRQARRYGAALIPEGIVTVSSTSRTIIRWFISFSDLELDKFEL